MIRTLISKDFLILRRNWIGLMINLALPLLITAMVGSIFGPSAKNDGLPIIKLAVVDEDKSVFGEFLRGALEQEVDGKHYFDPVFTTREEAMALIMDNQITAVMILPKDFTSDYLNGKKPAQIELIKNPTQRFLPAIVEELLSVVVDVLDAVSVNLSGEIPEIIEVFENDEMPDFAKLSKVILRIGKKFEKAEDYLFPPIMTYGRVEKETAEGAGDSEGEEEDGKPKFNIFAYLLPGLTGMFLLFIADLAVQGLFHERQLKTLDRFRTMYPGVMPLLISKAVYGVALLQLSAFILLGVGAMIFRFHWHAPLLVFTLVLSYAIFCVGFIFLLASLVQTAQRASVINSMAIMFMSFAGGSMMPVEALPAAFREFISPCFPNYWFIEALKSVQLGQGNIQWLPAVGGHILLGAICLVAAAWRYNQQLTKGAKA